MVVRSPKLPALRWHNSRPFRQVQKSVIRLSWLSQVAFLLRRIAHVMRPSIIQVSNVNGRDPMVRNVADYLVGWIT